MRPFLLLSKRLRMSSLRSPIQEIIDENTAVDISKKDNSLEYWMKELRWPKEYFEPESNMKSSPSFRGKQQEAGSAASWDAFQLRHCIPALHRVKEPC